MPLFRLQGGVFKPDSVSTCLSHKSVFFPFRLISVQKEARCLSVMKRVFEGGSYGNTEPFCPKQCAFCMGKQSILHGKPTHSGRETNSFWLRNQLFLVGNTNWNCLLWSVRSSEWDAHSPPFATRNMPNHPIISHNSPIFNLRYMMANKGDEVRGWGLCRKNNGVPSLRKAPQTGLFVTFRND